MPPDQEQVTPPPPPPPPPPPADDPPGGPPAAVTRPEGIPDDLWTDTGFNAEGFSKYRAPAADFPASADAYTLPTIDGVEIDAEDPLIPILRARAFEAGMGQAGFNSIITDYAGKLTELEGAQRTAALATIGDNAEGRINNVSTWLDGKLPKDEAAALKALTGDPHAMLGLERLMNSGVVAAPREQPPATPTRKTHEEIRALMASPKYSGRATERDQTVIKEVTDWYAEEERLKAKAALPPAAA